MIRSIYNINYSALNVYLPLKVLKIMLGYNTYYCKAQPLQLTALKKNNNNNFGTSLILY